jgi:hypothetical protein
MTVSVMLEQVDENAFRATAISGMPLVAEAATREEAVDRVRAMIQNRLAHAEVIQLDVPTPNPEQDSWARFAGCLRDHPDAAAVEQNMTEYRQEVDRDPQRP